MNLVLLIYHETTPLPGSDQRKARAACILATRVGVVRNMVATKRQETCWGVKKVAEIH